jgi:hypothetical protein
MAPDDERERASVAARVAFWEGVNPRLKSFNRLGGVAEVKRLRMAIHARIPWSMQPERARLEVLEAEAEAKGWRRLYETTQKQIASHDELIASTTESNEKLRREALRQIEQANKWAGRPRPGMTRRGSFRFQLRGRDAAEQRRPASG